VVDTYDSVSNLTRQTDGRGNTTHFTYDEARGKMNMTLYYSLTPEELDEYFSARSRVFVAGKKIPTIVISGYLIGVLALWLIGLLNQKIDFIESLILLVVTLFLVAPILLGLQTRKTLSEIIYGDWMSPTELTISAHGISVLFAAKQRRHPKQSKPIPWEKVRNIDNEEKFLCILHGYPKKRIIIPKSAFSTQEEIDKFITICSEYMNRCHGIHANCEWA